MRSKVMLGAAAAAMVAPSAAPASGSILSLETGHSIVISGHDITRVAVGDGRVAGAVPLDSHEIVINAKAEGETTIFVWDDGHRRTYELTVTEHRLDQIARLLQRSLNDPDLQVTVLGQTVLVGGHVPDLSAYQKVTDTIAEYKGLKFGADENGDPVILNTVQVVKPLGDLERRMQSIPNARDLRFDLDQNGDIVVSGRVRDREVEQNVLDSVNGLAGPFLKTDGKVIDRLVTDAKSLVDIKVDVLEVDKTAQSALGLQLQSAQESSISTNGNTNYTISTQPSLVAIENPNKVTNFGHVFDVGPFGRVSLLAPTLNLLLQEGHARLLSSPNLVTKPGTAATFLVGGQIPIPISNGLGTISIDYKTFGVQLNVTPTIDADGGVESEIAPEISDLDFADGIQINGFTVPAFKTSSIKTDVITNDGESIVMGGLLRRVEQKTISKIPLLADIPVLGELFRSTSYQKTDTDVVFVMTPYIVTKHNFDSDEASSRPPVVDAQPIQPSQVTPISPNAPASAAPTFSPAGPVPSTAPVAPIAGTPVPTPIPELPQPSISTPPASSDLGAPTNAPAATVPDLHPVPVANLARLRARMLAAGSARTTSSTDTIGADALGVPSGGDAVAENYQSDTENAWMRTDGLPTSTQSFAYFGSAGGPAISRHYLALVRY